MTTNNADHSVVGTINVIPDSQNKLQVQQYLANFHPAMSRIFTLSDIHVDFPANMAHMQALSSIKYTNDVLIIAGDISDDLEKIALLLREMKRKFRQVAFVPGNHELWVRKKSAADSLRKFEAIISLCDQLEVETRPFSVNSHPDKIWVVPLFSWYRDSENDPHSLYIAKEGEDLENNPWMDNYICRWPPTMQNNQVISDYFARLNIPHITRSYDAPVISFSHMLPRRELIFGNLDMAQRFGHGRTTIPIYSSDPTPEFNFTRVAGCQKIEQQLRTIKASVHIYGHQHRNRNRLIDGITYVSHCLGYHREKPAMNALTTPLLIWQNGRFIQPDDQITPEK